jgi:hypothetical protein
VTYQHIIYKQVEGPGVARVKPPVPQKTSKHQNSTKPHKPKPYQTPKKSKKTNKKVKEKTKKNCRKKTKQNIRKKYVFTLGRHIGGPPDHPQKVSAQSDQV